jgi:hypothetical protein
VAALLTWDRAAVPSYAQLLDTYAHGQYNPLGILRLLGSDPPGAAFFEVCKVTALVASLAMLVGLFSRVSTVVSLVAMLMVAGIRESFGVGWAHSYTPVLGVHLVFAFAPCGRMLSLDAVLRRRRKGGAEAAPPALVPAWPVLLTQLAVAFTFFNAAMWKIRTGGGLAWVFSDSLRHHILTAFDWVDNERTALADLIVQDATLWKVVAAANLLSQVAPMVACFFVHRPRVRFALGCFFVVETIALDLVMNLPNYHWLPLAVVFVDWDRLLQWAGRRWKLPAALQPAPPVEPPPAPHPLANLPIAGFMLLFLVFTVGPRGLDHGLNSYPLSQYRMFASVRAKKPYSEHQTWEFDTLRFAVEGSRMRVWPDAADTLNERLRKFVKARSQAQILSILRQARRRVSRVRPTSVEVSFYILQAPAYPAAAELVPHPIGILGQLRGSKEFRSLLGKAVVQRGAAPYLELKPAGVELPADFPVSYILDGDPRLRPLDIDRRSGNRIYYRPREGGRYTFVGQIGEERFILAEAKHRAERSGGEVTEETESEPEQP